MALREQRVWGVKERLFERVLPRLSETSLANLLQAAHQVDGIVKGLKQPDWPNDSWQALHRLAMQLCALCSGNVKPVAAPATAKSLQAIRFTDPSTTLNQPGR
jgi:DNA polymerase-3 subunit delta